MAGKLGQDKTNETEVIVSVPLSMLKELNYISGGKLTEESEPASPSEFSAAALGRRDQMTCTKRGNRGDYMVRLVKMASVSGL